MFRRSTVLLAAAVSAAALFVYSLLPSESAENTYIPETPIRKQDEPSGPSLVGRFPEFNEEESMYDYTSFGPIVEIKLDYGRSRSLEARVKAEPEGKPEDKKWWLQQKSFKKLFGWEDNYENHLANFKSYRTNKTDGLLNDIISQVFATQRNGIMVSINSPRFTTHYNWFAQGFEDKPGVLLGYDHGFEFLADDDTYKPSYWIDFKIEGKPGERYEHNFKLTYNHEGKLKRIGVQLNQLIDYEVGEDGSLTRVGGSRAQLKLLEEGYGFKMPSEIGVRNGAASLSLSINNGSVTRHVRLPMQLDLDEISRVRDGQLDSTALNLLSY